jgi:hypothetical protein
MTIFIVVQIAYAYGVIRPTYILVEDDEAYQAIDNSLMFISVSLVYLASLLFLLAFCRLQMVNSKSKNYPPSGYQRNNKEYCKYCKVIKRPDMEHCDECDICVEGYDHHCGVVGVCIGDASFKYFV